MFCIFLIFVELKHIFTHLAIDYITRHFVKKNENCFVHYKKVKN